MRTVRWLVACIAIWLTACSADLADYKNSTPDFDLYQYFDGEVVAWGMVQDYSNKQTRRFEVKIKGSVEDEQLTLVEDFLFDDGEIDQRIWTIQKLEDGSYQGVADDIIGVATGNVVGNALQWQYDFELEVDGSRYTVAFDDWLYRQDDRHLFNLTSIKKLGVEVATITIFFQKQ
ncbi:DUF3833 domain-containing protein [Vibrio hangzhouensis]|uniref:DUF3833 domain-containing protein n=1 Tax=Vibrio hangzhouensis TaxID=462991 RepID=A0A1H5ZWH3_9VIBR|nr:DUF3833 domain-containing protein [Vibrio hangzhouensis]SEG40809.1 Protein of unknown function [Vibrio hangzhouensis]